MSDKNVKQALILAAGKGSRLKSKISKALVQVRGKPLICNIIDNMIFAGVKTIYIVKYQDDDFSLIGEYYKDSEINIIFIEDKERKGSLWSFYQGEKYITSPFICTDCDLILNKDDFYSMLKHGQKKIYEEGYDGAVARVTNPSHEDVNMLLVNGNRAIGLNKEGGKDATRGGYIYIWNFSDIFKDSEPFLDNEIYSFSKYINFILNKYKIGIMDVKDLWDIDTYDDVNFTNNQY